MTTSDRALVISADGAVRRPLGEEAQGRQDQLIALWLHDRSPHTQRAYRADVERFLRARPDLQVVMVHDLLVYAAGLEGRPATRARSLSAIKSLLSFAHRTGYLTFNVGTAIRVPKASDHLAERILCEADVHRLINLGTTNTRDQVMLRTLYASGLRVSELASLIWRNVIHRPQGTQLNVIGKGNKARSIVLSAATGKELDKLRLDPPDPAAPVFRSRRGVALTGRGIREVVYKAVARAGLEAGVSPHWFRHAHASHALDRGAPIHLVQQTLGHTSVATTGRYLHARPQESSALHLGV
jgi:integrase/recombinase XerD